MTTVAEEGLDLGEAARRDDGADDASLLDDLRARESISGYTRSPSDLLRVVGFSIASLVLLVVTRWGEDAIVGLERDMLALFGFVNPPTERILAGIAQILVVLIGLGVYVVPVVLRRYRLLGYVLFSNLLAAGLTAAVVWWLDRSTPDRIANQVAARAGVDLDGVLSPVALAQIAASFVILAPFVNRRWRRAGAVMIGLLALLRLLLSANLPAELFLALAFGGLAGSATLLAFGRPDRHATIAAVAAGLEASGLPLAEIAPASVDARGSTPYFATLADGTRLFAKELSPEERSADLLFRVYRFLRLKNVGDERPFSSLRRTIEHEALVSLQARDVGVRTPRMRAIADLEGDSMLLAYELIDGRSMDRVDDAQLDDRLLAGVWEQVAILRRHRIAHRDLRQANVFVDAAGDAWLIDFGFSEVAASDDLLDADVAQLLASLAVRVGAERAVASAVGVLGEAAVGASLRRLQINALSGATQTALKQHKGLLGELQQAVARRCGVETPDFVKLERFDRSTLFTLVMLVLVTYFLLPQFADLPGIVRQIGEAHWIWFVPVLAASIVTYVGAAVSMTGAVPDRIRLGPTILAQVGSSFASKLAPASVGGMALNARYLQKSGVDPAVAVSGIGLNTVGGLLMHVTLLVLFFVWAGRSAFGTLELPDWHVFAYGVGAVLVLALVSFSIPRIRTAVRTKLFPVIGRALHGVVEVARRPGKVALLLGGSATVTTSYVVALYFATRAFDGDLSFAQIGAIYLAGAAVATAAPTPGGLGALEAAVIAGLVAAGMDNTVAVPSVFLYRLATFWLPILPGWISFTYLQRRDFI